MIGQTLSHYRIVEKLGEGGMGEVYRAKDLNLGRDIAIKVLPRDLASDPDRLRRFEREARTASALNHPNIVTIHAIHEHRGTHYIAMEFVKGKTLRVVVEAGPLSMKEILPLATQIAEGLSKAHAAGIVHRDLKPENVMVTEDGLVKILDFGLAKLTLAEGDLDSQMATLTKATRGGVILGTVQYMSPEQAAGRPFDYRSDQFSLGSILYEMATGKLAFKKATIPQTLAAIIEADPEPIQDINHAVPVEFSAIVERCLSKDPGTRYESTGELARELKAVPETPSPWRARRKVSRAAVGVAVLPLRNLSGDPQQEYFADGMTEALITDLAKISALKVISRSSTMRYKGTDKPLAEIARELKVDAVVEGSALRVGGSVRIMAQLIDPKTEQALWAESYERDLENVLILQSEVAQAIAGEVQVALTPEETKRLAAARPVNPEAYDAYLKGSYHWQKTTLEDLDTAERYFELALEKDPSYAPAYEGLAWVWGVRQQMGIKPPHEAGPKAKAAALQAIALDDSSAGAHEALALVRTWTEWDWGGAEPEWRRALELDPNAANTHAYFAHFLWITGRIDEAIPHSERALELDPFNALFHGLYSMVLCGAHRYDEAIAQAQSALRTAPNHWVAMWALMHGYHAKGMYEEHLAATKAYVAAVDIKEVKDALARGYAEAGYKGAMSLAAEALAASFGKAYALPVDIAVFFIYAGNHERALEWLQRSFEAHDPNMPYLGPMPVFQSLRSEPRFQDLLRRMNLPE